jgi:hypothetical protein
MPEVFFENTKTGKRYKVLEFGGDKVTLQGEHATFTEPYDKEKFVNLGYKLVQA